MKQPIAGVTAPQTREVTVMTVFPTLGAFSTGRLMGRLCGVQLGYGIFTLGNLFALLLIPFALALFAYSLLPWVLTRYRLTNRRVTVQKWVRPVDERWVDFDRFDTIDIEVQPGQEWYPCGDLVFRSGATETFRLAGVSRPETFRHTCLAARRGYLGAQQAS
ncbi:MAG: PH domain-containing protein [Planctomycetota bacterium]|nr:MAG: PH domain-containing protein [Planctomycetota bacterium]